MPDQPHKNRQPVVAYRRLLDREIVPFVGRDDAILQLREHLNAAFNNHGRFAIISGSSGIGKTRMVEQFITAVDPGDVIVMKARVFGAEGRDYEPFRSMLESFFNPHERAGIISRLIPLDIACGLLSVLPVLKKLYPVEITEKPIPVDSMLVAFNQVFDNISRLKPLIIYLDDLHLLSENSRKLLKSVVERIENKAMFVIGCYTIDKPRQEEWIDACDFDSRIFYNLGLKSFNIAESNIFISNIFGQDFSPVFQQWLYNITKGNPYFMKEFIKELVSTNVLTFNDKVQKWHIKQDYERISIPTTISSMFDSRFRQLDKKALKFLRIASLCGEQFDPDVVTRVQRLSKKTAERIIARLSQEFFVPIPGINYLQFVHPVEREILRNAIRDSRKRILHRKIARILERIQPGAFAAIAHHKTAILSEKEKTPQLCHFIFNTARKLTEAGDLSTGYHHYRLALDIATNFGNRFSIAKSIIHARLISLSMSLKHEISDLTHAKRIAKELMRAGFVRLAAQLQTMIYRYIYTQCSFKDAARYIRQVIRSLPREAQYEDILFRLKVEQSMVWRYVGRTESARRLLQRLLKKYQMGTNMSAYCYALNILGLIFYREGDLMNASKYFEQLKDIADELDKTPMKAVALMNLNAACSKMGKIDFARDLVQQYRALIVRTGQEYKMSIYWGAMGYCSLFQGDHHEALKFFEKALEKPINSYTEFSTSYLKAEILIYLKRLEEAARIFDQYPIDSMEPPVQGEWCAYAHAVRGLYFLKKREYPEALRSIDHAIDHAQSAEFAIEYGVALILKGIVLHLVSKKKSGRNTIVKGKKMLQQAQALSYLGSLLCEAGIVLKDTHMIDEGVKILETINAHGWLSYYKERTTAVHSKISTKDKETQESIQINVFGGLSVILPSHIEEIEVKQWKSQKARELLGLLLIADTGRGYTWGELALHLWPNFGTKDARNNFHFTLSTLRDTIGTDYIIHEHQFYSINREEVCSDLWKFERLFDEFLLSQAQNKLHQTEKCAKHAVKLAHGDFLPEFHNELVQAKHLEISQKTEELLLWLAKRCFDRHEFNEAMRCAYKIIEKDPVNEGAHGIIIKSFAASGERARALRQYDRLKNLLNQQFNLEPSIEVQEIVKTMRL
jgi:two-component SAPR family response regulator